MVRRITSKCFLRENIILLCLVVVGDVMILPNIEENAEPWSKSVALLADAVFTVSTIILSAMLGVILSYRFKLMGKF